MSENGSGSDFILPIVMSTVVIGNFLIEHGDMVEAMMQALAGGATKAQVLAGIRAGMVTAADAVVTADLGPRP